MLILRVFLAVLLLSSAPSAARDILVIGDSVLEWQSFRGASVGHVIQRQLGREVEMRAASGAKLYLTGGEDNPRGVIPAQYTPGPWRWVVLNGGANDLLTKCGCRTCDRVLDRLVSADGSRGILVDLLSRIRADGARVMILGYYRGNARPNLFTRCRAAVAELTRRQSSAAARIEGVHLLRTDTIIDPQIRAHYALDGFHPSRRGARRLGVAVATAVERLE